jgi:hypothetical protein
VWGYWRVKLCGCGGHWNIHFKTASMKTLTYYWDPLQRAFSGFQKADYEWENPFGNPLMRLKVYSLSCPAYWNLPVALQSGFWKPDSQNTSSFLKPASVLTARSGSRNIDSGTAFGKVSTISKCFHRSSITLIQAVGANMTSETLNRNNRLTLCSTRMEKLVPDIPLCLWWL